MAVIDNALQALFNISHWKVGWENASPASGFPAQEITVPGIDFYDFAIIKTRNSVNNGRVYYYLIGKNNNIDMQLIDVRNIISTINAMIIREVTMTATGFDFALSTWRAGNNTDRGSGPNNIIPQTIYLFKQ